jgi:hypothetical protein
MICWFENSNNDITSIDSHVFFLSCVSSRHSGYYIDEKNFRRFIALSTKGREVVGRGEWILNHNLYLAPKKGLR